MNLRQLLEWACRRHPDRTALVAAGDGQELTYAELESEVRAVAAGLSDQTAEGPIAVFAPNCREMVISLLAGWYLGRTMVPFNARSDAGEASYYLADSDANTLLFHGSVAEQVDPDAVETCIQFGESSPEWAESSQSLRGDVPPKPDLQEETRATIVYTSGTTGDPKGVPITHTNWVYRALVWILRDGITEEDTTGLVLPLYHVMGINAVIASLQAGATLVLPKAPSPDAILSAVDEHGITTMQGVPTLFKSIAESEAIDDCDTSSLRRIESAGGMLTDEVFAVCRERLCSEYRNFYGTTETMNISYARENVNSVGKPADFQEVRVVEAESRDPERTVDRGEVGEVAVRMDSPEVFDGYLNKPEKTAEVVHDGWYFTEDAGYWDEEGRLWLEGRIDDMIISGGENISPSEVEDALLSHPDVTEAAVVGQTDEKWGERVVAYVTTSGDVDGDELDEHCRSQSSLADFKRPRKYYFPDEIPKNPTGKIDRARLQKRANGE